MKESAVACVSDGANSADNSTCILLSLTVYVVLAEAMAAVLVNVVRPGIKFRSFFNKYLANDSL